MNINYLKKIISEKKLSTKDIAEQIGMTYEGLNKAYKEESIKVTTLEKICGILNVSPAIFFDVEKSGTTIQNNGNGLGNTVQIALSDCDKELQHLRELLAEKERTINILLKQIEK